MMLYLLLALLVYCVIAETSVYYRYKKAGYSVQDYRIVEQMSDPLFVSYAGYDLEYAKEVVENIKAKYNKK
jgi:hypothetical protein